MVFAQPFATKSVLSEGSFFKVALVESGIYKIDHAFLESMGVNPSNIEPSQLKMFGQPPGILPQANSDPAPDDLQETAIALHGMEDGRFDEDDCLLFYAQSPHPVKPVPELASFFIEPHLYSDTAYYFLQLDGDEGKRVAFQEAENIAFPDTLTAANDFVYLKDERRNLLFSGRHWVGQDFSDEQNLLKSFGFPEITLDSGSVLSLQASFVSTSGSKTELQFSINDAVAGNLSLPRVRRFAYGQQGTARLGDFTLSATDLPSTEGLSLTIDNLTGEGGGVYLEFFTVTFQRTLQRTAPCQHIRSFASLYRGGVMYQLANAEGTAVWDITDPWASREVELFTAGDTVFFHDEPGGKLHAFAWFADNNSEPRRREVEVRR